MATANGQMWIRDLFPDAKWDAKTGRIGLANDVWLGKGQYNMIGDKAYVDPNALSGIYAGRQSPQLDQGTFDKYAGIFEGIARPQYNARNEALQRQIDALMSKGENLTRNAETAFTTANTNLSRRKNEGLERAKRSAISRGTYTSGLHDYQQREVDNEFAPLFSDMETGRANVLANIAADTKNQLAEYAGQAKNLEADFMTNVFGQAMNQFNADSNKADAKNQYLAQLLKDIGRQNVEDARYADTTAENKRRWEEENRLNWYNANTSRVSANKSGGGMGNMNLGQAKQFAQQGLLTKGQDLYNQYLAEGKKAGAVNAGYPLQKALKQMMTDQGILGEYRQLNNADLLSVMDDLIRTTTKKDPNSYFASAKGSELNELYKSFQKNSQMSLADQLMLYATMAGTQY